MNLTPLSITAAAIGTNLLRLTAKRGPSKTLCFGWAVWGVNIGILAGEAIRRAV